MMQCDGCGAEVDEKGLYEIKVFGQRRYLCRACKSFPLR